MKTKNHRIFGRKRHKEVITTNTTYTMKMRVTSYEVGPLRTLKPSSILRIIQEVAGRHLEQDGLSYEFMREKGIVFLLVKQAVHVIDLPRCEDEITVKTWFERTEGVKFVRNIRFMNDLGETLIEAATQWIIADPNTHRVLRPSAFTFEMPKEGSDKVDAKISRIVVPDTAVDAGVRVVRWSDIDCNSHMNNAVYADVVCDFFPGGLGSSELSDFQIEYDGEAALSDEISIKTASIERGGAVITGRVAGRKCFTASAQKAV